MKRFQGKKILITGGSQGIGRACADLFADEGAEVWFNYSRDEQAAHRVEKAIAARDGRARALQADLGVPRQVESLWSEVSSGGNPDILILNAAFQKKATLDDTDMDLLRRTFEVNVFGNFQLARLFLHGRRREGGKGNLVIHSSNQSEFVHANGFAYGLSKAALNHMVRHLAAAAVRDGVRVNGVLLGWFDTEGERKVMSAAAIREQAAHGIPMGRAGDPREAARLTLFLASEDSSYMTGSLLRCDGGFALDPDLGT